ALPRRTTRPLQPRARGLRTPPGAARGPPLSSSLSDLAPGCDSVGTMSFTEPEPDELDGFTRRTLPLPREDDGELCATLVTLAEPQAPPDAPCVLWPHGFVDYFFHS